MIRLKKDEGGNIMRATRGDKMVLYVEFDDAEAQIHDMEILVSPTKLLNMDRAQLRDRLVIKVEQEREKILFQPADEHLQQFKDVDFEET